MKNISLLTYTHSNCSDVHPIYLDSIEKYFNSITHYILTNSPLQDIRVIEILYDDNTDYFEQILLGLSKLDTEYLIFSQEDFILFDFVNKDIIEKYISLMTEDINISFIRLINSGINGYEKNYNDDLVVLDSNHEYFFSCQVTIWRKKTLEDMFKKSKIKHIRQEPQNSSFLKSLGGIGLCVKQKGEKVGGHYNSLVYPYIATAITLGRWNFSEYGEKLKPILETYNIDKYKRGII
jgi:hypothetical protein